MNSNLFSVEKLGDSESFKKDLKIAEQLDQKILVSLVDSIKQDYLERNPAKSRAILQEASERLRVDLAKIKPVVDLGKFFIKCFLEEALAAGDSPEDIVEDLLSLSLINENSAKKLIVFLKELHKIAKNIELHHKERLFFEKCLPILKEIEISAELRPILDKDYNVTVKIDQYLPACTGLIPMAIIRLATTMGKDIIFQADEEIVRHLINYLEAVLKQIEATKKYLSLQ